MEFVAIADFRQTLAHYCPGLTTFRLDEAVRLAVAEFCRLTLVSQETMGPYGIAANDPLIPRESPASGVVEPLMVLDVQYLGRSLPPISERELGVGHGPQWRQRTGSRPLYWIQEARDFIRLYPIPSQTQANAITVRTAFVPSSSATEIDRAVADTYYQAIVDGTLHRVLSMPNKAWTDMALAGSHREEFHIAVSAARALVNRANTTTSLRAEMRRI